MPKKTRVQSVPSIFQPDVYGLFDDPRFLTFVIFAVFLKTGVDVWWERRAEFFESAILSHSWPTTMRSILFFHVDVLLTGLYHVKVIVI